MTVESACRNNSEELHVAVDDRFESSGTCASSAPMYRGGSTQDQITILADDGTGNYNPDINHRRATVISRTDLHWHKLSKSGI